MSTIVRLKLYRLDIPQAKDLSLARINIACTGEKESIMRIYGPLAQMGRMWCQSEARIHETYSTTPFGER